MAKSQIIIREAANSFDALRTAQGMENAGADVFSVANNGMHQPYGAMIPSARFVVFGKYASPVTPGLIDHAISAEFGKEPQE